MPFTGVTVERNSATIAMLPGKPVNASNGVKIASSSGLKPSPYFRIGPPMCSELSQKSWVRVNAVTTTGPGLGYTLVMMTVARTVAGTLINFYGNVMFAICGFAGGADRTTGTRALRRESL
ncbi:hypothetical protein Z517_03115 [Fonsecaea pedrosoi CBS 271.37]|uniref:Uncharacterized protein n=1 Tax=Fonsecaea pedrosoi CBS 271.37 TaxID=1442368 RepID=A0A0D2HHE5_9EURO|nr:uncharacterized protein Z517_03115 [Fonsecaea pedrosoi CBS 271.37]KIW83869.1 hypothetical protein Z517_03115 [Fonsecaea pedrosoi CBS 271.37]